MISETVLQQAALAQHERLIMIQRAWNAYKGLLAKPLLTKPGQPDDNINLNFARTIVDDGVGFLFGEDIVFEVAKEEDEAEGSQDPADVALTGFWKQNKKMTTLTKLALNGGTCGHTFVKLALPDATRKQKYPRLIVLDPATVTAVWDPDDYEDVLYYVIQWNAIDPYSRRAMVRRQVIEKEDGGQSWLITDQVSYGDSKVWETMNEPEIWPFMWSPIFHCQNLPSANEFWGTSDVESDIVDILIAINRTVSNTGRIIRFHAHPKTWGSGFQQRELNVGIDQTIILPSKDAKLANLEMQSDLSSSIQFYKELKEGLHVVAQHPEVATGKLENVGPLSGVALKLLYRPLLQKTRKKQMLYGDMLDSINMCVLEMLKFPETEVEIHWPNILPDDTKEEADTALELEQLGVSKDTLLTRLGFDADLEAEKKAKEKQDAVDMGAAMLQQFDKGQVPGQTAPGQNMQQGE